MVLVTKKDGCLRFCVDYRKLNDATVKDSYPLPRIDDSLDMLSGSKWFSTLDLASGYWQIEVDDTDKEKTAFTTSQGLYQFNVIPFGLCNALATFETLMEKILHGLHWDTCMIYIDDIIVYAVTFDEHVLPFTECITTFNGGPAKTITQEIHTLSKESRISRTCGI